MQQRESHAQVYRKREEERERGGELGLGFLEELCLLSLGHHGEEAGATCGGERRRTTGLGGAGDNGGESRREGRGGGGFQEHGGAAVEAAADGEGLVHGAPPQPRLQLHRVQAQPHHRRHPVAERRRGTARVRDGQVLDEPPRAVRAPEAALHAAGEHRDPDVRRGLLGDRI